MNNYNKDARSSSPGSTSPPGATHSAIVESVVGVLGVDIGEGVVALDSVISSSFFFGCNCIFFIIAFVPAKDDEFDEGEKHLDGDDDNECVEVNMVGIDVLVPVEKDAESGDDESILNNDQQSFNNFGCEFVLDEVDECKKS